MSEEEVKKFGNISSKWWEPSGEFAALRAMNHLRIPLIKNSLAQERKDIDLKSRATPLEGFKILDVGCGGGLVCEVLLSKLLQEH